MCKMINFSYLSWNIWKGDKHCKNATNGGSKKMWVHNGTSFFVMQRLTVVRSLSQLISVIKREELKTE